MYVYLYSFSDLKVLGDTNDSVSMYLPNVIMIVKDTYILLRYRHLLGSIVIVLVFILDPTDPGTDCPHWYVGIPVGSSD